MPYRNRIQTLKESHRIIDETIKKLEAENADPAKITEFQQKKIQYRQEISRMERLQWENDHDTVNFDDDR
jgi:hypothetical protein